METGNSENSRWIPLECNPKVFNLWAHKSGLVTSQDEFVDIYGLDENLLSIIPKPTKAVVLLFPLNSAINVKQKERDNKIAAEGQHPVDHTLLFVKQKVENACGTMALIHAIANSDVTYIPDSPLQKFIKACKDKTPEERAEFLESTDLFTQIHLDSSALGQTPQPTNDEDGMRTNLHFTCFVAAPDGEVREAAVKNEKRILVGSESVTEGSGSTAAVLTSEFPPPGLGDIAKAMSHTGGSLFTTGTAPEEGQLEGMRLIELDGRRPFPVDHGPCTDVLDDAIDVIKRQYLSQVESVYFSLMAFGAAPSDDNLFYD